MANNGIFGPSGGPQGGPTRRVVARNPFVAAANKPTPPQPVNRRGHRWVGQPVTLPKPKPPIMTARPPVAPPPQPVRPNRPVTRSDGWIGLDDPNRRVR